MGLAAKTAESIYSKPDSKLHSCSSPSPAKMDSSPGLITTSLFSPEPFGGPCLTNGVRACVNFVHILPARFSVAANNDNMCH